MSATPPTVAAEGRPREIRAWLVEAGRLSLVAVQLGIIFLIARAFRIENASFYRQIMPLALGGFVIHHFLPRRYRPAFFGVLGIVGVLVVFGPGPGTWLVAVGLGLIGLCHVPVAFRWRVVLLLVALAVLIALRADWLTAPWPGAVWPILASMFMFRLAIYLYDLKHHGAPEPGLTIAYFFLLPNIVFPLFPVIDFHTFRRTYYDRDSIEIYQEGVRWILRGFTHLILYRFVYQYVAMSPAAAESTAGLVQYLVGNFGLYLRVSGQFHVAIGMLHLFGFRLPETHRFFYLASSFSDLWRRINIYWKDFMQKLVYLPVFFGLKRLGETTALVAATVTVVAATWFLHSYQWFWLLGNWLFSATDALFWGILCVFLVANTLREQRRGRVRQITARARSTGAGLRHAAQTAGMFVLMCVLWGLWTSPSIEDFRDLLRVVTFRPIDMAAIGAVLITVATVAFFVQRWSLDTPSQLGIRRWSQQPLLTGALPLAAIWGLGQPPLAGRLPPLAQEMLRVTRVAELNKYDAERLQRGYYETIVGMNRFDGQLWDVYSQGQRRPRGATIEALSAVGSRDDALQEELRPLVGTVYRGGTFRTNRWGMRDRDYQLQPPPNTLRMAVLGPSYVMGQGVNHGEPFEAVLEDRLNADWLPKTGLHYEVLNFAVPSYSLMQQALVMENGRVSAFAPNVVLVVGNISDIRDLEEYIWEELSAGRSLGPRIERWVKDAALNPPRSRVEAERRLRPYRSEMVRFALDRIKAQADLLGAQAVYALIPMPTDPLEPETRTTLLDAATDSGFTTINMADVFESREEMALALNIADRHPNAEAHRIIADRLYRELIERSIVR